jgi:hypothetical protein
MGISPKLVDLESNQDFSVPETDVLPITPSTNIPPDQNGGTGERRATKAGYPRGAAIQIPIGGTPFPAEGSPVRPFQSAGAPVPPL